MKLPKTVPLRPVADVAHKTLPCSNGLSPLHRAHASLARTLQQVQDQVGEMYKLSHACRITPLEVERFCCDLELINSTLQGWFFLFEEAARRPSFICDAENHFAVPANCTDFKAHVNDGDPALFSQFSHRKTREVHTLSDSPLVQGIGKDGWSFSSLSSSNVLFQDLPPDPFLHVKDQLCKKDNPFLHATEESFRKEDHLKMKFPLREPSVVKLENSDEPLPSIAIVPQVASISSKAAPLANGAVLNVAMEFTPVASFVDYALCSPPTIGLWSAKNSPENAELVTPEVPQTLLKKYSKILASVQKDLSMEIQTPVFLSSHARAYIRLKYLPTEDQDISLMTPVMSSPFRTSGLFLGEPCPNSSILPLSRISEEIQVTSIIKHGGLERIPAAGSEYGTPVLTLDDMEFLIAVKPGCGPQPGEQTLKRELWARLEAASASSIAVVCKSLFPESESKPSKDTER